MIRTVHIAADPTVDTILRKWLDQYIQQLVLLLAQF